MPSLIALDLSWNSFIGTIPPSLHELNNLIALDLSYNHLSGQIPWHWGNSGYLSSIDLSWNKLSGHVPYSICSQLPLLSLKLKSNNLSGNLSWLNNCSSLSFLDIGDNGFSGRIPEWIGENLPLLQELGLRANSLTGNVPDQLCLLSDLHILDLALNNLSSTIPLCLGELSGFRSLKAYNSLPPTLRLYYETQMDLVMKGRELSYSRTLELVNIVDLSGNNLVGTIPESITNLSFLGTLNVSRNQLTGRIPDKIGDLRWLETLDLSNNQLWGLIPSSMTYATSLNHLNLSHNNLTGPIPSGNQFQTFDDPSIYEGNLGLCGFPLSTKCSITPPKDDGDEEHRHDKDEEEDDDNWSDYKLGLYVSTGVGFIAGLWAVCGSLVVKRSWRHAYFRFLEEMKDRVLATIVIKWVRFRRMLQGSTRN